MQRYAYDATTFRLLRLTSEKFTHPSGQPLTYEPVGSSIKQDTKYTYDLAGNIVSTLDATANCGVAGAATLTRNFDYDPLYRLISATGRESNHFSNSATPHNEGSYVPAYPLNTSGTNAKPNSSPITAPQS